MGREVLCCSEGWQQAIIYEMFSPFLSVLLNVGEGTSRFAKMKTGGGGQNREYIYEDGMPNGQRGKKEKGGKQPRVLHAKCNSQR